jgi:hypothetical protein
MSADPRVVLLRDWLVAIADATLDRDELFDVRGRIDPASNEFDPSPLLDEVRRAVMSALDVRPGDLPDSEPLPDFVPDGWAQ